VGGAFDCATTASSLADFVFDVCHSESRDIAGRVALLLWQIWAARNDVIWNDAHIRPILEKTAYELFKERRPNISYFHQFGCTCYILNNKLYLKKFDANAQRGIFLGYSERSKAYRVYNSETLYVEKSMHVKFDDKEPGNETPEQGESFADMQVPEDTSEPDQTPESKESLEA